MFTMLTLCVNLHTLPLYRLYVQCMGVYCDVCVGGKDIEGSTTDMVQARND